MMQNDTIQMDVDLYLMKKMTFIGTMQKVFGVLAVITGAISCIGIVTAIFGVPYIIAGVKLYKSGSAFTFAAYSNDGKFMKDAILNLAGFWMYTLVMICLLVIFYIVMIMLIFMLAGDRFYY